MQRLVYMYPHVTVIDNIARQRPHHSSSPCEASRAWRVHGFRAVGKGRILIADLVLANIHHSIRRGPITPLLLLLQFMLDLSLFLQTRSLVFRLGTGSNVCSLVQHHLPDQPCGKPTARAAYHTLSASNQTVALARWAANKRADSDMHRYGSTSSACTAFTGHCTLQNR